MSSLPPYVPLAEFSRELADAGFVTPDTYCKLFDYARNEPAVYLFLMVDIRDYDPSALAGFVAYVGMSTKLKQRLSKHPIRAEIDGKGHWIMTWFKRVPTPDLRVVEANYIQKYSPPWNINGKVRGVAFNG